eukprot:1555556-Alexandrium_andersonii.AAC.1
MSASLVGSEMCIRDRPPSALRPRAGGRGCGPSPRAPGRPGGPTRSRPVSYTHLTLPTICSV